MLRFALRRLRGCRPRGNHYDEHNPVDDVHDRDDRNFDIYDRALDVHLDVYLHYVHDAPAPNGM